MFEIIVSRKDLQIKAISELIDNQPIKFDWNCDLDCGYCYFNNEKSAKQFIKDMMLIHCTINQLEYAYNDNTNMGV